MQSKLINLSEIINNDVSCENESHRHGSLIGWRLRRHCRMPALIPMAESSSNKVTSSRYLATDQQKSRTGYYIVRDHLLSTYAKYSYTLTFLSSWYAQVRVCVSGGNKSYFFWKILRKYYMNDPSGKKLFWATETCSTMRRLVKSGDIALKG